MQLQLTSTSFKDGGVIPREYGFCIPAAEGHVCLGANRNPHLAWSGVPAGTRSFALICHDPDVPNRGDEVNQEGETVAATLPRVDFFHWVLVDIPAATTEIAAGSHSSEVTPGGKPGPEAPGGTRHGVNDYTGWFARDPAMGGDYHGYDGPCPPWNDEIPHRYVFTLYALDVERCPVEGSFTGAQVRTAVAGHVLAEGRLMGRYSLNPTVKL